ncbi:MAG: hemerythrin HHE cation-binding protein, partial [Comamonadaceae bacterium]
AFETNCDPLTGKYPCDPVYEQLFTRIVNHAPAPIGLGED